MTLIAFFNANPEARVDDDLVLDVVIGHAVRVGWQQRNPAENSIDYSSHKGDAWEAFYLSSPAECRRWQLLALRELAMFN